jgi:diguanylate cyclase (GGDEF)-like protein
MPKNKREQSMRVHLIWAIPLMIIAASLVLINALVYLFLSLTNQSQIWEKMQLTLLISTALALLGGYVVYHFVKKISTQSQAYEKALQASNDALVGANQALKEQLFVDGLTGLGNRKALNRAMNGMEYPRLILLDIDEFQKINDYFGSTVGDEVLVFVKEELEKVASMHHLQLFRVGPDQFALIEEGHADLERYEELAIKLVELFKGRRLSSKRVNKKIEINCTIGFSLENEEVLEKASIALKEAKHLKRDYLCYFRNIDQTAQYGLQLDWSNAIKDALENDYILPFYQPIFNRQGEIAKYECLVRMMNDKEEVFSPALFMNTSQKVRLYPEIEKVIIEKSLSIAAQTQCTISLNLLARDMTDSDVSNFIIDRLAHYQVAKHVVIEILEDESIEYIDRVAIFIDRVKRMGVKIAIDDFGTGYSNFSYLLKLKPDYLKIDGSIIRDVDKDPNAYAIVSAIVVFAQKLGIKTIAEFIHSKAVYEACYAIGIDEYQGFYLAEPRAKPI